MTRTSLASEVGLDEKQIRRIEKGESSLRLLTVMKIFYVLQLDLDVLKEYFNDDSILH